MDPGHRGGQGVVLDTAPYLSCAGVMTTEQASCGGWLGSQTPRRTDSTSRPVSDATRPTKHVQGQPALNVLALRLRVGPIASTPYFR